MTRPPLVSLWLRSVHPSGLSLALIMLIWTSNDGHFVSATGDVADWAAPPLHTGDPAVCVCALMLLV